jgi:DNA-binding response OmpR family regulator
MTDRMRTGTIHAVELKNGELFPSGVHFPPMDRRLLLIEVQDLRIDPAARRVWRDTEGIVLTPWEYARLEYLVMRRKLDRPDRPSPINTIRGRGYSHHALMLVLLSYRAEKVDPE